MHVSLTRISLWILSLGVFDPKYVEETANKKEGHEEIKPEMLTAETPVGTYEGYTDQVQMSETPEHYDTALVPRGANKAEWLPR
ncbi:hypothetical protein [Bacillus sp. EB600]|uniref:hypothetical protein n=1 Tax=Bacillus sp. EB600 TaxID=2806345 RepID=UPI00210D931A|nr:hypothetical protein [Bacillus sp. EB600]MCQ6278598.1 hypothetical protein [Bacillus sp. EB600]